MFYWIYHSPPGYSGDKSFMVRPAVTADPESFALPISFAASVEDARAKIPRPCRKVENATVPYGFVELWESEIST